MEVAGGGGVPLKSVSGAGAEGANKTEAKGDELLENLFPEAFVTGSISNGSVSLPPSALPSPAASPNFGAMKGQVHGLGEALAKAGQLGQLESVQEHQQVIPT